MENNNRVPIYKYLYGHMLMKLCGNISIDFGRWIFMLFYSFLLE